MATVDTVVDAYRTYLNREPDPQGLAFWMESYETFVKDFGETGAVAKLKDYFLDSEEYKTNFGGKL
jgi:hypothetical protein